MADKPQCPYGVSLSEGFMTCEKFREATGFVCTVPLAVCKLHVRAGGPDVPLQDVPKLDRLITVLLRGRLVAGDAPEFQGPNPMDLRKVARKLKARLAPQERRLIWRRAVRYWASVPESPEAGRGGHPAEVIEQKARELASEWEIDAEAEAKML